MCFGGSDSTEIKPTADQIAQQQINAKLWNHYVQNYKPVIEKYSAQITSPETQRAEKAEVSGQIGAEVMKNIRPETVTANPVANTRQLVGVGALESAAKVTGGSKVASKQASDVQNIINIGRGDVTEASADLASLAASSVKKEISSKELELQEAAALQNAIGTAVGMGAAGAARALRTPRSLSNLEPQDWSSSAEDYWLTERP